jgi:hypothetical protein
MEYYIQLFFIYINFSIKYYTVCEKIDLPTGNTTNYVKHYALEDFEDRFECPKTILARFRSV